MLVKIHKQYAVMCMILFYCVCILALCLVMLNGASNYH